MSKLEIYGVAASRTARNLWMAQELGLDFDHKQITTDNTRKDDFLAINPNGQIPAIKDGELHLCESMAINLYLARKHNKLLPASIEDQGRMYMWSFWVVTEMEDDLLTYMFHNRMLPDEAKDASLAEKAEKGLQAPLAVLDAHLEGRDWMVGDEFTVADLNVASIMLWAKFGKLDISKFENVSRWLGACLSRPAAKLG